MKHGFALPTGILLTIITCGGAASAESPAGRLERSASKVASTAAPSYVVGAASRSSTGALPCSAFRDSTYRWAATSRCYWEPTWNHRAWIRCEYKEGSATKTGTFYGPWRGTTSESTAICPASTKRVLALDVEQGYFD